MPYPAHHDNQACRSVHRFQFDAEWRRDFLALAHAVACQREHIAAGLQLRDAGALDEAARELALADEQQEHIEILKHALRDLR